MDSICKVCNGSGWIPYLVPSSNVSIPVWDSETGKYKELHIYAQEKDCMIDYASRCPECNGGQAIIEYTKKRAQLPTSYYDAEMKDFDWTIYRDDNDRQIDMQKRQMYVESFVRNFTEWRKEGLGLYIWSRTRGSGKTYLASCICNTLIKQYGVKPKFVSAFDLIKIEKTASDDKYASHYEKDPIAELCDCDLLVIDDLGSQNGDAWTSKILYRISDFRMQEKKVTIITSNAKSGELPFDDKMIDRINSLTQAIPLPEYRVRAKASNDNKRKLFTRLGLMKARNE